MTEREKDMPRVARNDRSGVWIGDAGRNLWRGYESKS